MSNEQKKEAKNKKPQVPNNVIQLPQHCPAEDCKKKQKRAGFCEEHFTWFKAGLISRDGQRPKDFDKKYQAWHRKQAA